MHTVAITTSQIDRVSRCWLAKRKSTPSNLVLHFEADKETNDALREYFDGRAFEIRAALGPRVEVEQWTNSWSRVHEVMPYTKLNEELVESVSKKLAQMITVLQPMLEGYKR